MHEKKTTKPRNKHTQTKKEKHKFKKSDQNQTKVTQSIKTNTTFKPDIISQSTNTYEEEKQGKHKQNKDETCMQRRKSKNKL